MKKTLLFASIIFTLGFLRLYVSNAQDIATDPVFGIRVNKSHTIAPNPGGETGEEEVENSSDYDSPHLPVDVKVNDLISKMTLEEKLGQLNTPYLEPEEFGKNLLQKQEVAEFLTLGLYKPYLGPVAGFFANPNNLWQEGAEQQAKKYNELQKKAIHETRLGIPLLMTEEGTHGLMCAGATIFPEGPGLGSTWNMDLVKKVYSAVAKEARSVGVHQLFTLVVEPIRDPRLGRNQEGYSEDPFFCARMAETIVEAIQGDELSSPETAVAGLCHFPGQSEPVGGMERGAMEISERKLREVFLPPWEAGIRKKGAMAVMATYPSIDGIPTHASDHLLTGILREELGFEGIVLSEGFGFETLTYTGIAKDQGEAGALAINAGVDISITFEDAYLEPLKNNVEKGVVSMDIIDRSVSRVLHLKYALGLFENPYVDPAKAADVVHSKEHRNIALEAARESIVLLKNDKQLLPLSKNIGRIAVIGPNADHERNQLGDYTSKVILQDIVTVLDGIRATASPSTRIDYVRGCDVIETESEDIARAVKVAKKADVAIVVLGENEWQTPERKGTSGEGFDVASLDLTGLQQELLENVYATGTPVVLVLINGRPLSIRWAAEHVPAIVEGWIPGDYGGKAIAEVLFGEYNPNGKLPVTFPRHSGQLPMYYNYKPEKEYWMNEGWGKAYADMPATPLWEFGYGLSYTHFDYSDLLIEPAETGLQGSVRIQFKVKNTGEKAGKEVAQLYIRDVHASVPRPVKELRGFEKISLQPGEEKTISLDLSYADFSFLNENMARITEPGEFKIMVGGSSQDIRLKGSLFLTE